MWGRRRRLARVAGGVALEASVALPVAATHIVRGGWRADAAPCSAAVAASAHDCIRAAAAAAVAPVAHVGLVASAASGGVNLRGAERGTTRRPKDMVPERVACRGTAVAIQRAPCPPRRHEAWRGAVVAHLGPGQERRPWRRRRGFCRRRRGRQRCVLCGHTQYEEEACTHLRVNKHR